MKRCIPGEDGNRRRGDRLSRPVDRRAELLGVDVLGQQGPFQVRLRVEEGRLAIDLADHEAMALDTIRLGLGRFRRPIREYFHICDAYFKAVRSGDLKGIETIDMARPPSTYDGRTSTG